MLSRLFRRHPEPGESGESAEAAPATPETGQEPAPAVETIVRAGDGVRQTGPQKASVGGGVRPVYFDGLSEEWRLAGNMHIAGRLSDALNKREPIELTEMRWASVFGDQPLEDAPGLQAIDPYDLIIVLAGGGSLPPLSEEERYALRVRKMPYDVALEVPPYRVVGRIFLHPGVSPQRILERGAEMFLPVTDAVATLDGRRLNDESLDVILVNRYYLRGLEVIDSATGLPASDSSEGNAP